MSDHCWTYDDGRSANRSRHVSNHIYIHLMNASRKIMVGCAGTIAVVLLVAIIWFQVWWADWVVQSLFNKDYNNWLILAVLFALEILTPDRLRGLTSMLLFLSTIYIWIAL